jgi:arabinan endo-1,5-alpha-L-arabinosidase
MRFCVGLVAISLACTALVEPKSPTVSTQGSIDACAPRSETNDIAGLPYTLIGDVCPVHDPSAMCTNVTACYLFSTDVGDSSPPFLLQRCSYDGMRSWKICGSVFNEIPAWSKNFTSASTIWAPDISYFNGQFHLYYALSSFGSQNSVIGHATTASLEPTDPAYHWTDAGPIISSNDSVGFNAIDPSVLVMSSGQVWLAFGSFWHGIYAIQLDGTGAAFPTDNATVTHLAERSSPDALEAAFLWTNGSYAYLFSSWNYCCRGTQSTYEVRVGRSAADAQLNFTDAAGVSLLNGGGTYVIGKNAGWAAGGGQSVVHQFAETGMATLAAQSTAVPVMVLHAYDGVSGDPWVQFIPFQLNSSSNPWPVVES